MNEYPVYKYKDFMEDNFPFKLEFRNEKDINRILHAHEPFQLCYILKGTCCHYINGQKHILVKGDIFAIPPFMSHTMASIDKKEVRLVQIDFMHFFINENMRDLSQIDSFVDFAYIQPILSAGEKLYPKLNVSPASQLIIEQLIAGMKRELEAKEDGYRLSIKADLLKLLVLVGREFKNFSGKSKENKAVQLHREAFHEAIDYIEKNYGREIKLEDIAQIATMSSSYFCHIFKLIKGKTFIEYLNQLRISKAMELMKSSNKNITEICFSVGYNNVGHFNRMFKNITGNTPSEYRKQQ